MKPPPSKPGTAGETQSIDLQDVELFLADGRSDRSLPPPLPPEVRASHVPSAPPVNAPPAPASLPPPPPHALSAPEGRSPAFYVVALLVFLVVGVGGGLLVAIRLRRPAAQPVAAIPSGAPQAAVITIPTVEVDDEADGGK